ncbi:hypothetical protein L3X38_039691 [Prunus dulcis]|uniref:Uncharacterized protein n=1 Tax=Prunus dulcis TaxID=3755 RepID=A0AAD4V7Y9_PRUDU|nr:hypothetical protein L3X38_039691 [Prunus dulcis]
MDSTSDNEKHQREPSPGASDVNPTHIKNCSSDGREVLNTDDCKEDPLEGSRNSKVMKGILVSFQLIGVPSPSHRFTPKIFSTQCARDGGLTRKEIKEFDNNSECSKARKNQACQNISINAILRI